MQALPDGHPFLPLLRPAQLLGAGQTLDREPVIETDEQLEGLREVIFRIGRGAGGEPLRLLPGDFRFVSQAASAEAERAMRRLEAHAAIGADGSDGVAETAGAGA